MAENDDRSGSLQRNVSVYEAAGSPNLEKAEKILKIFGDPVQKAARTLVFKAYVKDNSEKKAIHEVQNLPGVDSAIPRKKGNSASPAPLTLHVTGNFDTDTVLKTLQQYGEACPSPWA